MCVCMYNTPACDCIKHPRGMLLTMLSRRTLCSDARGKNGGAALRNVRRWPICGSGWGALVARSRTFRDHIASTAPQRAALWRQFLTSEVTAITPFADPLFPSTRR